MNAASNGTSLTQPLRSEFRLLSALSADASEEDGDDDALATKGLSAPRNMSSPKHMAPKGQALSPPNVNCELEATKKQSGGVSMLMPLPWAIAAAGGG